MKRSLKHISIFLLVTAVLTGCNLYPQDSYKPQYVVESYLAAGQHLPEVRVSTTLPTDALYSYAKSAVNTATVQVRLLSANGSVEQRYPYFRIGEGLYVTNSKAVVLPLRKYQLYVTIPGDSQDITASTVVPGTFHHVSNVPDTAIYQSPKLIEVRTTRSYYPGRQSYFVFTVIASDTSEANLTPFYASRVSNNSDVHASDYYKNSSGIVNQDNYKVNSDSTITLKIPWLGFAFYGENTIVTSVIDNNMYDFLRSQAAQTGGSTLPPGVIPNLLYHVNGGIGIFGSMATDTVHIYLKK